MSPTATLQRVWETFRSSIYDLKNEQIPNFHIINPQILNSTLFLGRLPIQCDGAPKKVVKVKI